jgi:stage V sporulation protein S
MFFFDFSKPLDSDRKILYNLHSRVVHLSCVAITHRQRRAASMDVIKVSGTSRTSAVAGAIAGVFRENKRAEVQAIGATAINQAVKALAIAKSYLTRDGLDIVFTPEFVDVEIGDKVRTAIKFVVTLR